jgi:hypothetical protein
MEFRDWMALVSACVAAVSVFVVVLNRRDSTTNAQLAALLSPIIKDAETAKHEAASAKAKAADLAMEILKLEVKLLERLTQYPTTEHMDTLLKTALQPVLLHVAKVETFMDEVIRSGALNQHKH